jgi:hypothetical protein
MTLLYRGETRFDLIGAIPVKLPLSLKGNKGVICRVDCQQAKRTWKTLGSLEHYTFDQDFGTIKLGSYPIPLSTDTLIDLRVVPNSWLVFSPVRWLLYRTNITIFSTEDLSVEIQVPDLEIADEDIVLARDYSDNYTLKRTTFSRIASFVREKFADLVDAIATNTSNITANTSAIATNTSNITANTSAIATNTSNITANTSAITVLNFQSGITSNTDVQYSSTRPTTRRDGTALRSGDLWKKTGQDLAEFDGVQWVSPKHYLAASSVFTATNAFTLPLSIPFMIIGNTPTANIKIISVDVLTAVVTGGSTLDINNFWVIESLTRNREGGDSLNIGASFTFNSMSVNLTWTRLIQNRVLSPVFLTSLGLRLTRTGSPSQLITSHQICYAHVL